MQIVIAQLSFGNDNLYGL